MTVIATPSSSSAEIPPACLPARLDIGLALFPEPMRGVAQ